MDRRIGAQYYTLRDYIKTIEEFDEACKKVKEIGYQIVQISGCPLGAVEMREVLDKYELKCVLTHRAFEDFLENLDEVMEYNRILGSEVCGVGSMPNKYRKTNEGITEFIEAAMKNHKMVDAPTVEQILAAETQSHEYICKAAGL